MSSSTSHNAKAPETVEFPCLFIEWRGTEVSPACNDNQNLRKRRQVLNETTFNSRHGKPAQKADLPSAQFKLRLS